MSVVLLQNKMSAYYFIFIFFLASFNTTIFAYTLPAINLGSSSFLDGGPLRQIPGWYGQSYTIFYTTHRFLDERGKLLLGIPSPRYNLLANTFQLTYLSHKDFFGLGNFGFDITLPVALYSRIEKNQLGITSSGSGIGDLVVGVYAQALPIMRANGDPFYVHRLEFVAIFPTGIDKRPLKGINPGSGVYYIDPYWAATLYFTPRFATSWRLHYLWASTHHTTHIKPGDAIHWNWTFEYAIKPNFWVGLNSYFLQQIKESTLFGIPIPHSKERVLGLGVGWLYSLERQYAFVLFGNLYFETLVRNRTQGIKFVFRVLKHF